MLSRITLDFKISNCRYRCVHCDVAKDDLCKNVPLQRIKEVALSFLAHKGSLFEKLFVVISDSAFLYKDYPALVEFLDTHRTRYNKEPINGVRYDQAFFDKIFPGIAQSPLDTVRISLFGSELTHNKFAGYRDSFQELMTFAKAFSAYNKHVVFHLYVTPESFDEIASLKKFIVSEVENCSFTYEYSNCYKDNYERRDQFLLTKSYREKVKQYNFPLISEEELADSCKGKKPILWRNNIWIRIFGNGDYTVAVFPLGGFYLVGNMNEDNPETIMAKCVEYVQNLESKLPSYDQLIENVFNLDDPFLYAPSDALNLWWARYSKKSSHTIKYRRSP